MDDLDNLDDILDRALEEFEEEEMNRLAQGSAEAAGVSDGGGKPVGTLLHEQHSTAVTSELNRMIADLEDPTNAATLQQTYEQLSGVGKIVRDRAPLPTTAECPCATLGVNVHFEQCSVAGWRGSGDARGIFGTAERKGAAFGTG